MILKKKESPNNGRIQTEMKPTQKEAVYLTLSLSWEEISMEPKKKKKNEKGRKSTQATIAHSSNIWQQIIMPSLQLINSHLVIDINKGRVVFISATSKAAMKTLEMLFLLPLVSKATKPNSSTSVQGNGIKAIQLFKQDPVLTPAVVANNHILFHPLAIYLFDTRVAHRFLGSVADWIKWVSAWNGRWLQIYLK